MLWNDRKKEDKGNDCLISINGTDFRVAESGRAFYSFKFKKSALRYEIGLCILTGQRSEKLSDVKVEGQKEFT